MDNPNYTGSPDRDRISLHQDYEVRYWTHKWGVTKEQLIEAEKKAHSSLVRHIHDALVELGHIQPQI